MKLENKIVLLAFCWGLMLPAYCENLRLSNSALSRDIAQPQISALYTDSRGLLWIGTSEGLYQFDGAEYSKFHSNESGSNWISSGDIRDISEDVEGNLLVATFDGGILLWNVHSNSFLPYESKLLTKDTKIARMYVAKNGNIWVVTTDQIVLLAPDITGVSAWLATDKAKNAIGRPITLLESDAGILFVGSSQGLIIISLSDRIIYKPDLSSLQIPGEFVVSAIEFNKNGDLVFGTDNGHLGILDPKSGRLLTNTMATNTSVIISNIKFHKGKLLISSDRGLYLSDMNLTQIRDISHEGSGLSSADVHSMHVDGDRVWIGTYNGLDILSFAPFDLFNFKNSGIYNDILSFHQDIFDRVWIGTYNGLYFYDTASESHLNFESRPNLSALTDQRVTALGVSKQRLWVGFYRDGYQAFDFATNGAFEPALKNSGKLFVTDIDAEEEDDIGVWIATYNEGLLRITPQKTYSYFDNASYTDTGITRVLSENQRVFVVSTNNNFYEYNRSTDTFSLLNFDLGANEKALNIFSLAEDKAGNLWLGTKDHGLFLWSSADQEAVRYNLEPVSRDTDLQHSTIYGIEPDQSGNLWCSTQNGIVKLDSRGQLIKRFTTADGLQGKDFSFGASFQTRDGIIYFGGTNGYNRFDPEKIAVENEPSRMRLTGISLPGRNPNDFGAIDELQSLLLTHKDHSVTFQFSVLDFIDTERNQFRYKLENFDTEWIENGTNNTATFTNLPSGEYTLRVQGANSSGIWNRDGISLAVTVLPAPWLTWWAYTLYGITLMSLVWALHRIYQSYVVERRSAELALEMFEAENKADDDMQEQLEIQDEWVNSAHLHSQTTLSLISESISIRNSDSSDNTSDNVAESSIKRIAALHSLEDCLSYEVGGPLANLHKYTDELFPELLKKSPIAPETIVTINEVTTIPIRVEIASPLAVIIYELLENCFQHAFEPDSPANYVHIKLSPAETSTAPYHSLELYIHDSGIGMPVDVERLGSDCCGLALVKSIVGKLGGTLRVCQASGTMISIELPHPHYA
jgi:ligand-binding sensor domain-containing protein/two-component sensor histidine kinase